MRHIEKDRNGFALPVALFAMVVIGAIVTGGFYASNQESRISNSTDLGSQAFYLAEYGLEEAMGTWRNGDIDDITALEEFDAVDVTSGGRTLGTYQLTVRRIGVQVFLVTSEGRADGGPRAQAVRRVAAMIRTTMPSMPAPTALALFGGLSVSGNSYINGADAGGPGCEPGESVAGVTAYDSTLVSEGNKDHITGEPPISQDPSLDTDALSDFGSMDLQALIDAATKVYGAGENVSNMEPVTTTNAAGETVCDMSVKENWGDPSDTPGPCGDEFPIIYAEGNLSLQTGGGQGILIVNGDLSATGNFDFYGVVIVLGELFTAGTGNHLEGSVIVQGDGNLDSDSQSTGNSLVQYSKCRVDRAFNASMRPRPLAKRAWIDFSATTRATTTVTGG